MGNISILFCICLFLFGVAVGAMLDAIEVDSTFSQALDDAYRAGYEQGKKEEKQKNDKWIESVTDDGK